MKKILFSLFLMLTIFSLSSCRNQGKINIIEPSNSDEQNPDNTVVQTPSEDNTTSTNPEDLNGTVSADIMVNTSTNASPATSVETTVDQVYDSVVSINVRSTSMSGSGSGVLFAEDKNLGLSFIVTCFHVIEDCSVIEVALTNGEAYPASLVGGYSDEDLAVISIEKTDLCYASFYEDSDKLKLGSQVVCIGNPLGTLPGSVSSGYLSYKNREIQVDNYRKQKLLQTDVAINSGNSGGGLFNTSGALIGIVNAKYADEAIEGLGFAIPINTVRGIIESLVSTAKYNDTVKKWKNGYVAGDWEFGFEVSDGRYTTGGGFWGNVSYVIYVSDVSTNETTSGNQLLKKEDIITAVKINYKDEAKIDIDSISISSANTLLNALYTADLSIGDQIIFTINRSNTTETITVELEQYTYSI